MHLHYWGPNQMMNAFVLTHVGRSFGSSATIVNKEITGPNNTCVGLRANTCMFDEISVKRLLGMIRRI